MNINRYILILTATLLTTAFSPAWCSAILLDSGSGPGAGTTTRDTWGFDFTVGASPILVTTLGIWDYAPQGLNQAHPVGLWDISGTLLGTVVVPSGNAATLDNGFRYAPLTTPVLLSAGQEYVLGAWFDIATQDFYVVNSDANQASFDAAVLPGNARDTFPNGQFSFPSREDGAGSRVGPNAQFTVVPEPASAALLLFGAVFCLRRRTLRT